MLKRLKSAKWKIAETGLGLQIVIQALLTLHTPQSTLTTEMIYIVYNSKHYTLNNKHYTLHTKKRTLHTTH